MSQLKRTIIELGKQEQTINKLTKEMEDLVTVLALLANREKDSTITITVEEMKNLPMKHFNMANDKEGNLVIKLLEKANTT